MSTLTNIDIDFEDALFGTAFTAAAAVSAGLATIQIIGYALSDVLTTISGIEITIASLVSIVALSAAYLTNRVNQSPNKSYEIETDVNALIKGDATIETYVVIATLATVVLVGFDLFGLATAIQGSLLFGVPVLIVQLAGYYVVSYIN